MPRNALTKRLLEEDIIETDSMAVSKFGVEQITNVYEALENGVAKYTGNHGYNPLLEIAKLGFRTDNEDLAFKCHAKLAEFLHPQVKSIEINAKEDKEVKITVQLAGYAQTSPTDYVEPEDIETEGEVLEEKPHDYTDMVLGAKNKDLNN